MSLADFINRLEPHSDNDLIHEAVTQLRQALDDQQRVIGELEREGRLLHIGIVGQVKAGKSSFLNALLFGGQDFLPHAATPMTAALTRLEYADQPRAEFDFYTDKEWQGFEQEHARYEAYRQRLMEQQHEQRLGAKPALSVPPPEPGIQTKAAWEVVQMARKQGFDPSVLRTEDAVLEAADVADLFAGLANYVGAEGRYTPFVKSVTLYLNQPELRDLVLIDTPGTNDPVVSRGERTREYLKRCDLVFVLSVTGRFLDASDMALIQEHLGSAGIRRAALIGSRFDEDLIGEYKKYQQLGPKSLLAAYKANQDKLSIQARKVLAEIDIGEERLRALRDALPPRFVSARLHALGIKPEAEWSEAERHTYQQFQKRYPQADLSQKTLLTLGNISAQMNLLDEARADKAQIQRQKIDDFKAKQASRPLEILSDAASEINRRMETLKTGEIDVLKAGHDLLEQQIRRTEGIVDGLFDDAVTEMRRQYRELGLDLREEGLDAQLHIQQREERRYRPAKWWQFWKSGEDYTSVYSTAAVQDAIDEIKRLLTLSERAILERSRNIIDLEGFKKRLISEMAQVFDLGDENFDPDQLLRPVRKVVNRIGLPELSLDEEKVLKDIREAFSYQDEVRDGKLDRLKRLFSKAKNQAVEEVSRQIEAHATRAEAQLRDQAKRLIDEILEDSRNETQIQTEELKDREANLNKYEELHTLIQELIGTLRRNTASKTSNPPLNEISDEKTSSGE